MRRSVLIAAAAIALARAQSSETFFESRIRPLLTARCLACHGELATGGLRLDSPEGMLKGGATGPAVTPGDASASLIIQAVTHTHARLKMPPQSRLPNAEIEDLRLWIRDGAVWPSAKPAVAKKPGRDFWSFQPLKLTTPNTTIDSLIDARLTASGLVKNTRAEPRVLLRRINFDLTGLPPAPDEIDAFLADHAPGAFTRAVDRLLASPHFGERWARHWLDVARYAEDDVLGLSQESYPNAWRYRDWVVEALNRDLPYDVFLKAQIAADLLPPDPRLDLTGALGFFGLGPWYYTIKPPAEARADERHDRVDTLTRGVLGLTVGCARCHDHKFDPISTRDYYGIAAIFFNTEYKEYPLAPSAVVEGYEKHQQRVKNLEREIKEFLERQDRQLGESLARKTARYLLAARAGNAPDLDSAVLDRWKQYLAKEEHDHPFLDAWTKHAGETAAQDFQSLVLRVLVEKREIDAENEIILAPTRPKKNAPKTRLPNGFTTYDEFCPGCAVVVKSLERDKYVLWSDLFRYAGKKPGGVLSMGEDEIVRFLPGEWKKHLDELREELKQLQSTAPEAYPFFHGIGDKEAIADLRIHLRGSPYNLGDPAPRRFLEVLGGANQGAFRNGSGRRELAEVIAAHPLAARVAANRIWGHLMGSHLVATPSNFGVMGERPSHPELLEHLASRFVERGWSVKFLIREIVLSDTYQRSVAGNAANERRDAGNRLYWRANRRRLDAESIRDAILAVSGSLDRRVGGPPVDLASDLQRRTLYGKVSRFRLNETLELFDFPNPSITAEKRNVTNVPLQRLFFMNSDLVRKQAEATAARVARDAPGSDAERINRAYRLLFARVPTVEEVSLGVAYLKSAAWSEYAHALLTTTEFLHVE